MIPLVVVNSVKIDSIPFRINVCSGFIVTECCFLYKEQVLPYLIDCYSLLSYNLQGYIVVQYLNKFLFHIVQKRKGENYR